MDPILLRPEEAAKYLNLGRSKAYELTRAGALESARIGTRRRIRRDEVQRHVASLSSTAAVS